MTEANIGGQPPRRKVRTFRWRWMAPRLALVPALAITAIGFIGSILITVWLSFTESRRFPVFELSGFRQYIRLSRDDQWTTALHNLAILGAGSVAAVILGFILAALIEKEVRGEGLFRTVFLYPLAVSLIVTGLVWRWLFNPSLGVQAAVRSLGWESFDFNWLASPQTSIYGIILASVWQGTGFFMALMLSGLKSIDTEIWKAGKIDGVPFWRFYLEVVIPMMKFTFLSSAIILSIGTVKAYDVIVAMTNGGPSDGSFVPAFFTINAFWVRYNLGYASAAATIMLAITLLLFLPFIIYAALRRRRAS